MGQGDGVVRLPADPSKAPKIRQKMPQPFQRPSITIGGGANRVAREWRLVKATEIREGDIVTGVGRVFSVEEKVEMPERLTFTDSVTYTGDLSFWTVVVRGGADNVRLFQGNDEVFAFVEVN